MLNRLFVFVYDNLCIGGIQTYIYNTVKYLNKNDYEVLLIHDPRYKIDSSFLDVFGCAKNQIISMDKSFNNLLNYVNDHSYENITIITFKFTDFIDIESLRNKSQQNMDTFYFVPNFRGYYYYIEESFFGICKKIINKKLKPIFKKMVSNGQIRFFTLSHWEKVKSTYQIEDIADYQKLCVPNYDEKVDFDARMKCRIYSSGVFPIISVSRFDFPHKGYLIGLIKDYARIKEKYPQLTLTIIGYGAGKVQIEEEIDSLPDDIKKSIYLYGKCSLEELYHFYSMAMLNISLAGCCSLGAKCGTLSVPARHYTYNCECYGFLPEYKDYITSDIPGRPLFEVIDEVMSLKESEYVSLCKAGYDYYNRSNESYTSIDDYNHCEENISKEDIIFIKILKPFIRMNLFFIGYFNAIKTEGLSNFIIKRIRKKLKKGIFNGNK